MDKYYDYEAQKAIPHHTGRSYSLNISEFSDTLLKVSSSFKLSNYFNYTYKSKGNLDFNSNYNSYSNNDDYGLYEVISK